ncbi:MAG: 16S rRNA (adenine(1518)-N(6)/adenine(1519)-N(6))-dimethyltransferase RsmA [Gammaproteobacteria bacterium]
MSRPVEGPAGDKHRARKRFGQNFLHDPNIIARIVRAIDPQPAQAVVEIGPGMGALTGPLVAAAGFLDVIEIDRDLAPRIAERFGERAEVHLADALKFDFAALAQKRGQPLRVVGNLPYNISTPLVFHLLDNAAHIRDMHFMLQKEVVDRMGAAAGDDDYGRLTVMVQYRCKVEPLFNVPPEAFNPRPKVHSAIVRLIPRAPTRAARDERLLYQLVTAAFSQRRKTLRNAVRSLLDETDIVACGIDPGVRPEMLDVAQFVALADAAAARGVVAADLPPEPAP